MESPNDKKLVGGLDDNMCDGHGMTRLYSLQCKKLTWQLPRSCEGSQAKVASNKRQQQIVDVSGAMAKQHCESSAICCYMR